MCLSDVSRRSYVAAWPWRLRVVLSEAPACTVVPSEVMLTTVIERGGLLSAARPASASRSDGLITACASHRTMWSPDHRTVQVVLDGAIGVKRFTYWVSALRLYSLQWVSSMGRWRHVGLPRLILAARSSASRHIGLRGCGRFLTRPGIGRVHDPVARHCGVHCAEHRRCR